MYLFVISCVINKMYWKFFIDENLWKNSSPLVYTFSTIVSLHATFLRPLKLLGFFVRLQRIWMNWNWNWIGICCCEYMNLRTMLCGRQWNEVYLPVLCTDFIYIVLFYRWKQKKLYLFWGKNTHTPHNHLLMMIRFWIWFLNSRVQGETV